MSVGGLHIAFQTREGVAPGLVWLGGYRSDMNGTKAFCNIFVVKSFYTSKVFMHWLNQTFRQNRKAIALLPRIDNGRSPLLHRWSLLPIDLTTNDLPAAASRD